MPKNRGRLTEPMVRENGALRPASWDEALDVAALRHALEDKGQQRP